jgi:N-methylhydantoinase A
MTELQTKSLSIAVDTGGTFTDLVVADATQILGLYKALTTPDDLLLGIGEALEQAAADLDMEMTDLLGASGSFVYSTTHSTNAILEGKTARTAFLTTRGNPDILTYKEGGKDQVHNWAIPFPPPYIPRRLTFEVTERVLADGSVAVALDEAELQRTMDRLKELEVEAVGVCLLWSTVNSAHETRVGELLEAGLPGVEVSLSHRVNGIIREYRRASATVIDASLKPLIRRAADGDACVRRCPATRPDDRQAGANHRLRARTGADCRAGRTERRTAGSRQGPHCG